MIPSTSREIFYGDVNEGVKRSHKEDKTARKKLNIYGRRVGKSYLEYMDPKGEKMQQSITKEERKMGARDNVMR